MKYGYYVGKYIERAPTYSCIHIWMQKVDAAIHYFFLN